MLGKFNFTALPRQWLHELMISLCLRVHFCQPALGRPVRAAEALPPRRSGRLRRHRRLILLRRGELAQSEAFVDQRSGRPATFVGFIG